MCYKTLPVLDSCQTVKKPCVKMSHSKRSRHIHLTFQTSGVEFDEELSSARCLHYGLDALKLNVGLL